MPIKYTDKLKIGKQGICRQRLPRHTSPVPTDVDAVGKWSLNCAETDERNKLIYLETTITPIGFYDMIILCPPFSSIKGLSAAKLPDGPTPAPDQASRYGQAGKKKTR